MRLVICLLIMLVSITLSAVTSEYTKTFEYPKVRENGKYISIEYDGGISIGEEGSPRLPWFGIDLLLPFGEQLESVTVIAIEYYSEIKTGVIEPTGKMLPISESFPDNYQAVPDPEIYEKDANYPENILKKFSTGFLCGHSIGNMSICPVEYNPVKKTINFISSITLELKTKTVEATEELSLNLRGGNEITKRLERIVENPEAINYYRYTERITDYDLLLITSRELAAGFQEYIDFKNSTGYSTVLELTNDIYDTYDGIDDADKVRNCIIDYYQNYGIEYVILGGDTGNLYEETIIPHREFFGGANGDIPSDIYYSNLDGTWNDDGDEYWGEVWGELYEIDDYSEVAVGRMCVDNAAEVENMCSKHILYQNEPVVEDIEKGVMVGEQLDQWTWGGNCKDQIAEGGTYDGYSTTGFPANFNINCFYEEEGVFTQNDIFTEFSETGINLLNHLGHSNANYNMKLYNSDLTEENFTNNGINRGLAIGYSQGCYNGSFDNWHAHGYYTEDCFAEKMTGGITGGEVACIANSRYGYYCPGGTDSSSQYYDRMFFDGLFGEDISHIGDINCYSHEADVSLLTEAVMRKTLFATNLFGDPSLAIWTAQPQDINVTLPQTIMLDITDISIQTDVADAWVAISQNNELLVRDFTDINGNVTLELEAGLAPYPLDVSVTAHNYNRYEGEIEVVSELPCVVYQAHTLHDDEGNGNGEPDYGEVISLSLELYNGGNQDSYNTVMEISTEDEFITIIDGDETCGIIDANSVIELPDAVSFEISDAVPNHHEVEFNITINGEAREEWESSFLITMNAPELELGEVIINDSESGNDNGILDPGETAEFEVQIFNIGGSDSPPATMSLMTNVSLVTIDEQSVELEGISAGGNVSGNFTVQAAETIAPGSIAEFILNCQAGNYESGSSFSKPVGLVQEGFESGDFSAFGWELTGDSSWTISASAYEGSFSAVSGAIENNESCSIELEIDVLFAGEISFMRQVSTNSYEDYLYFYLDGERVLCSSGEFSWTLAVYEVAQGHHTLEWRYDKTSNEPYGSDCVWIDNIVFPALGIPEPAVIVPSVNALTISAHQGESAITSLTIGNEGEENLHWTVTKDYLNSRETGGPDNYGYTWMDSNEGGSVEFDWLDISTSGNAVTFNSNDVGTPLMPLGFTFNFYGIDYTEFMINPNGWIGFGIDNYGWSNLSLPDIEAPRPAIMPLWDDLYPLIGTEGGGTVYYQNYDDYIVVMFHDVIHYPGDFNGTYDFEVIIRESGSIKMQYNALTGDLNTCTIGIQNEDGSDALQVVHNDNYLEEGLAVEFRKVVNWLDISPASGEIEIYNQQTLTLNASTSELTPGQYVCDLLIHSNDPIQETLVIPLTLDVGEPIFYGDVDGSLAVDESDSYCVLQYAAGLDPLPEIDPLPWEIERFEAADVDNNNILESIDGTIILQFVAGIIDIFPAQSGEQINIPDAEISLTGINDNGNQYLQLVSEGEIFALSMNAPALENISLGEPELLSNDDAILAFNNIDEWAFSCCNALAFPENEAVLRIPVELDETAGTETFEIQINMADWEEYDFDFSTLASNNNEIVYANELKGNYPNPFNPVTTFAFSVSKNNTPVKIDIYNIKGQLVKKLENDLYDAGIHQITWDASTLASGVYLYRCKIAEHYTNRKLLLLK